MFYSQAKARRGAVCDESLTHVSEDQFLMATWGLSLTYPDETLRPSCASSKSLRVDYTQDNQAFSLPIYVHEKCRSTWGVIC